MTETSAQPPAPVRAALAEAVRAVTPQAEDLVAASAEEVGTSADYLRPFVTAALAATAAGRRLERRELATCRRVGAEAAEHGVSADTIVDLYLSATWRLWGAVARGSSRDADVLVALGTWLVRAADDATSALAEGYDEAQRRSVRQEEALHREFVDDLLTGRVTGPGQDERAARFGFVLSGPHRVVVAATYRRVSDFGPIHTAAQSELRRRDVDSDVLITTKHGLAVAVLPRTVSEPASLMRSVLETSGGGPWRLGIGGVHRGPGGVARSFDQARVALDLADRAGSGLEDAHYDRLVAWRFLTHDPDAVDEVVETVLGGLARARGGPEPLVRTIEAFVETGLNISATARMLHVTPRGVSHRLATIERLTGYDPRDADDRFTLELAVRARRLRPAE